MKDAGIDGTGVGGNGTGNGKAPQPAN